MRRSILIVLALFLVVGLAVTTYDGARAQDKVRIALILPSTIDDMAWSQGMYEGVVAAQEELGQDNLEFTVSENMYNIVDAGSAMRDYAMQGYDIVICHGAQYQTTIMEVAPEFPDVSFAYGTGFATIDNVFAYDPQAQQGAFLLGMLAANLTKSGKVGIVGPVEAGDAIKFNDGFKMGVAAINPDVEVFVSYTGSFGDTAGAGEMAKAHMDNGADFLTGTAQQSVGAIQAAAEREGVYWLSNDMDQSTLAPDTVLVAQAYYWKDVVMRMIQARQEGIVGGEHLVLSFANNRVQLVYNPELEDMVPQEVKDQIDAARKAIVFMDEWAAARAAAAEE
jgi:basic membrane protein A